MTEQDQLSDPTHVLVSTTSGDASDEAEATAAAVEAVLDYADTLVLSIDGDSLSADHPDIAHRLERTSDSTSDDVVRGPVEDIRSPLADLLALSSFHRFVTLERIDAFRNGQQVLHYVPDHRRFTINAEPTDQLEAGIAAAIRSEPIALLPATVLADWYEDGTHYTLEPPSLCVDDACFSLSSIDGLEFDESDREIRILWSDSGGITASVISFLRPGRPTHFQFDSADQYETVAEAFRDVATQLAVEIKEEG